MVRVSQKIRVAFVIESLYRGGTERRLFRLLRGIDKSKFKCVVFCLTSKMPLAEDMEKKGIRIVGVNRRKIYDPISFFRFVVSLYRFHPHILHEFILEESLEVWGRLAGWLLHIPAILSFEGTINQRKGKLDFLIDRLFATITDLKMFNSRALYNFVRLHTSLPVSKCCIVPNGMEIPSFPSSERQRYVRQNFALSQHSKVVGIVANNRPFKDLATFLQAASIISQKESNVKFVIVGEGGNPRDRDYPKDYAHRLKIVDKVVFCGLVKDVWPIIALFDVGVVSSVTESCPNTLLEYMALAKPVVATAVGGVPEIVVDGKTGLLIPPGDPQALARAVLWISEHPEEARQMGLQGLRRVRESYSIQEMVRTVENNYLQVLEKKILHKDEVTRARDIMAREKTSVLSVIGSMHHGGTERLCYDILSRLNQKRFILTACAFDKTPQTDVIERFRNIGIEVIIFPENGEGIISKLRYIKDLFCLLHRHHFDIVHTHHYTANLCGRIAAILARGPMIISHEHNLATHEKFFHILVMRVLNRLSFTNIVASNAIKKFRVAGCGLNQRGITVIRNGIDSARFTSQDINKQIAKANFGLQQFSKVVAVAGRLVPWKRADLFLKAASNVARQDSSCGFAVFGEGPDEPGLRRTAETLGIKDRVIFVPWVDDMVRAYAAVDVFCHVAEEEEGFGLVIAEAMACGIPVVAVRVSATEELLSHGGGVLVEASPEKIAEAILRYLKDERLTLETGRVGRKIAKDLFNINRTAKDIGRLYLQAYYEAKNSNRSLVKQLKWRRICESLLSLDSSLRRK